MIPPTSPMKSHPILTRAIAFRARVVPLVASRGRRATLAVPRALLLAALLIPFSPGCARWPAVGPDYQKPATAIPFTYKSADYGSWKVGHALDNVPKGN